MWFSVWLMETLSSGAVPGMRLLLLWVHIEWVPLVMVMAPYRRPMLEYLIFPLLLTHFLHSFPQGVFCIGTASWRSFWDPQVAAVPVLVLNFLLLRLTSKTKNLALSQLTGEWTPSVSLERESQGTQVSQVSNKWIWVTQKKWRSLIVSLPWSLTWGHQMHGWVSPAP